MLTRFPQGIGIHRHRIRSGNEATVHQHRTGAVVEEQGGHDLDARHTAVFPPAEDDVVGVIVASPGLNPAAHRIGIRARASQGEYRGRPRRQRDGICGPALPQPLRLPDPQPGTDGGENQESNAEKNPGAR